LNIELGAIYAACIFMHYALAFALSLQLELALIFPRISILLKIKNQLRNNIIAVTCTRPVPVYLTIWPKTQTSGQLFPCFCG